MLCAATAIAAAPEVEVGDAFTLVVRPIEQDGRRVGILELTREGENVVAQAVLTRRPAGHAPG